MRAPGLPFLFLSAIGLLILHMVLLASGPPVERHLRVHADIAPMRIVLISDLHVSAPGDSEDRLTDTIGRINGLSPDLVLIAGDVLSNGTRFVRSATAQQATAPLAALRSRLGTIAVLGNHDYVERHALADAFASRGVLLLDNQAVRRGPLAILGIADATTGHDRAGLAVADWRGIGGLPIAFTHSPDAIPTVDPAVRLILAGHTHCGQIALPGYGAILTASRVGRLYGCGIVRDAGRTSVVTAGLGISMLPARFGASPDYWVIDIGR